MDAEAPNIGLNSRRRAGMPRARARYLVQALELEESTGAGVAGPAILLTTLLLVGAGVWSALTEVNEIARTQGEIVPSGLVRPIQHLEGGIVAELFVENGSRVAAGDPLLQLADESVRGEVTQLVSRRAALDLRRRRLEALLGNEEIDLDRLDGDYAADLVALQQQVFSTQRQSEIEQLQLIRKERGRLQEELTSRAAQVESLTREVNLLRKEADRQSELLARGLVAESDTTDLTLALVRTEGDLYRTQGEWGSLVQQLEASEQRERELVSRREETWNLELEEVVTALSEVDAKLRAMRDRSARLTVTAPVGGVVQGLAITGPGSVVEPGQAVLQIVPGDERLLVQTRISPADIGHIQAGQSVDVKVSSYEPQRYGTIVGELTKVSPSTYLNEKREAYYLAEVALQQEYLGEDPRLHRVVPGMLVQADIITGRKTVLDYLLRPVYRGFTGALHER
jgi:HlyD family type I secretion membrane fusion protein